MLHAASIGKYLAHRVYTAYRTGSDRIAQFRFRPAVGAWLGPHGNYVKSRERGENHRIYYAAESCYKYRYRPREKLFVCVPKRRAENEENRIYTKITSITYIVQCL